MGFETIEYKGGVDKFHGFETLYYAQQTEYEYAVLSLESVSVFDNPDNAKKYADKINGLRNSYFSIWNGDYEALFEDCKVAVYKCCHRD